MKNYYRLRFEDFVPIAGPDNYNLRNSVTDGLKVKLDGRARWRMNLLKAYDVLIIAAVTAGTGLVALTN